MTAAAAIVLASGLLLLRLLAPVRFFMDEWQLIVERHDFGLESLLADHNGHPSVLPALSYLVGFHTVGLDGFWYYRLVLVGLHLGICGLLAARVWRRHGPIPAVAVWTTVCFLGAGAENIVWPFQIGFLGSVLFFLLAVGRLERLAAGGRPWDAALAALCVTGAIMCSNVGVAVLVTVIVIVLVVEELRRHWWVVVPPTALYLVWQAVEGTSAHDGTDPVTVLRFLWELVESAGAALVAGNGPAGVVVLAVLTLIAAVRIRSGESSVIDVAGLIFVFTFWVLVSWGRGSFLLENGQTSPGRYQYVAVVGLVLVFCQTLPRATAHISRMVSGSIVGVLAVGSVWAGYPELLATRDLVVDVSRASAARLAVVDAHPDRVPADQHIDYMLLLLNPSLADIGRYLDASRDLGSQAGFAPAELSRESPEVQWHAENLMMGVFSVDPIADGACRSGGRLGEVTEYEAGRTVTFETSAEITLLVARLLEADPEGAGSRELGPGRWRVSFPPDDFPESWTLSVHGEANLLECG